MPNNSRSESAKITGIYCPLPASGRSLLASQIAVSGARDLHERVLVVDLNEFHTSPARWVGVREVPTPARLQIDRVSSENIQRLIAEGPDGCHFLDGYSILHTLSNPWKFSEILDMVKPHYDHIVIDLPSRLPEYLIPYLHTLVLIITDDTEKHAAYRGLALPEAVTLMPVLNFVEGRERVKRGLITQNLGWDLSLSLPHDTTATRLAMQLLQPLSTVAPDSPLTLAIGQLSRRIRRKLVGIALGSGAAQGLAHIGILKALHRAKIPIDMISGTSGGALYGAVYAAGKSTDWMEEIALRDAKRWLVTYADFVFPRSGLLDGRQVLKVIQDYVGNARFQDLAIPFVAMATDLATGHEVALTSGRVADAIRASISIPGIFVPAHIKGKHLIDGAVASPVPVAILQKMGAHTIIAASVSGYGSPTENKLRIEEGETESAPRGLLEKAHRRMQKELHTFKLPGIFDIIMRAREITIDRMAESNCSLADHVIRPSLWKFGWMDYRRAPEIIAAGEEAAEQALPEIRKLITTPQ